MTQESEHKLCVLPLGGLGEIGLNMMAVAYGRDALLIDTGLMFPNESMPGVDLVIPDVDPLLRLGWNVLGIILTHGHEDHIGALPFVLTRISAPIYTTRFTMGLVEAKLDEFDLLSKTTREVISPEVPLELGPFRVEFFSMCHSIVDTLGLAVTTPAGTIMHSGDFKLDPTPINGQLCALEQITAIARRGVRVLFSDSTNAEIPGSTRSESILRHAFERLFRESQGRILIATFASNIHRIQQVLWVARDFGRKVVLVGRSMESNTRIASELGYLDIPRGLLVSLEDLDSLPDDRITILSTGSQGEPMSALSLMAQDRHKYLRVKTGDMVVFSSRMIPGNERAINQIINEFWRRGAMVVHDKVADVHVSGHASQEELRYLIRLVQPDCFVPIHGEYRHLICHARIARGEGLAPERVLVAQNGDLLEVGPQGVTVREKLDVGRVFVHGKGVGDVGHDVLRERRILSEVGVVTVVLVVSSDTARLIKDPVISSLGVTFQEVEPELNEEVWVAVKDRLAELSPQTRAQWEAVKEEVRLTVRRCINRILGRKPLVQTIFVYV